ncbi:MAG: enoyl-CoA hydratase-related protein [Firmicutes bacterium]|nr:enoyl-CoA hydratase-related protein [Bacillota bacterium]
MEHWSLEVEDGVALLTVDRPQALNALNLEVIDELFLAVGRVREDESVRALVITGAGDRAFVAGADIAEMKDMTADEARRFSEHGQEVLASIENLPFPTIAAVNGYALGGGCELALACDIRIASETAKFAQPETGLGIIPGFGGTVRLPRVVGHARAAHMILTGETLSAQDALACGLVNMVVPASELLSTARSLAQRIASRSKVALAAARKCLACGREAPGQGGYRIESEQFARCFETPHPRLGMEAFLAKKKPEFD